MKDEIRIISEVNLSKLTEDEWNEFLSFHERIYIEIFPDEPYDKNYERKQLIKGFPCTKSYHWLVKFRDHIIGYAQLFFFTENDPNFQQNQKISRGFILVDKPYRRKKIGTELYFQIKEKALVFNKKVFSFKTTSSAGWSFLEHFGGKMVLKSTESYLVLRDVDWHKMDIWRRHGYANIDGITLKNYSTIPNELINQFIILEDDVLSNVPTDNSQLIEKTSKEMLRNEEKLDRENNIKRTYKLSMEKDRHLSGFTIIIYNPNTPDVIEQGLTGVAKSYQGRGLGKLLKSEMLFEVKENFPLVDKIYTANANSNAPMLKINNEMGFKELSTWKHYEIELTISSKEL